MIVSHSYHSQPLQQLIEKSEKLGWSISEINWDQIPIVPMGVTQPDYIDMISQLYHAELFTLKICARLITEVPDFQAIRFICAQMNEEARHAQAYATYIAMLGKMNPINEKLATVFSKALTWQGSYCGLIVALNVVMESEALNQQRKRIETLPCPIFKEINSRIISDEARHSGFGFMYLKDKLPLLAQSGKTKIIKWIESLWSDWKIANEDRYIFDGAEILRTSNEELDSRLKIQHRVFEKIGLI
ncbi:MAG: ferritin-like domain-containing protein [Gammaproteobacteria bacterium]